MLSKCLRDPTIHYPIRVLPSLVGRLGSGRRRRVELRGELSLAAALQQQHACAVLGVASQTETEPVTATATTRAAAAAAEGKAKGEEGNNI